MAYKIFLSHNSKDFNLVQTLVQDAQYLGIQVYAYEHDLQPGTPMAAKIRGAIQESDAVVAILTRFGSSSAYVQQEIGAALAANKVVIPIVETGIPDSSLAMLQGIEYIPLDWRNLVGTRRSLTAYLQQMKQGKEESQRNLTIAVGALALLFLLGGRK